MVIFPNCKINLGLHIIEKRADGYHELETIFYPVPIKDALEILPLPPEKEGTVEFTQSGLTIEGDPSNNICIKAYQLLKKLHPNLPGIHLHLHKQIPMGAGLGGGSADAAFLLVALNEKFNLGIGQEKLKELALELGSDCPFFLYNQPCIAYGRGEKLEAIDVNLSGWKIVIINPGITISTAAAFKGVQPRKANHSLKEIIQLPPTKWKNQLMNQFEESIFVQYPELNQLKEELYTLGATYASMSGSGSTLYGLFEKSISLSAKFIAGHAYYREYVLP